VSDVSDWADESTEFSEPAVPAESAAPEMPTDFAESNDLHLIMPEDVTPHAEEVGEMEPVVTETMAEVYAKQGLYEQARETYEKLLQQRPGDPALERKLAEISQEVDTQMVGGTSSRFSISATGVGRDGFWALFAWGSQMFIGALWVAIPALISMLVITLSMGVMTRAAPQLNIFSVGFPVTMFMGFVILILVMPGFLPRFNQMMLQAMQLSQSMVTP